MPFVARALRGKPVRLIVTLRPEETAGSAVLLTHDGYGHTTPADRSACVIARMGEYLTETTPPPGTVSPSDRQPFDPDFG